MNVFGIRHLSPAGAHYVNEYLDKCNPDIVLIEGPSDFDSFIGDITGEDVGPPFAVMSYTLEPPVKSVLYPFAVYSPEYQALLWAQKNKKESHFIDLPSGIILAFDEEDESEDGFDLGVDFEEFWERNLEQSAAMSGYLNGSAEFGKGLRELQMKPGRRLAMNILRESYMKMKIKSFADSGIKEDKIAVITGAFHAGALENTDGSMSNEELGGLPFVKTCSTLMPYSYYRLSTRSGYGAGNIAPAYYELLWESMEGDDCMLYEKKYLSGLAEAKREGGDIVSSAQVIDAALLARTLASVRGGRLPALSDLKDAAVTAMGEGSLAKMADAFAKLDIGTKIGEVVKSDTQTSIQNDFSAKLKLLKLEQYRKLTAEPLRLDLRENLRVKSDAAAFLDLNRSFFLHQLEVLEIGFAKLQKNNQENATWAEDWILQWSPEAEIRLVENVLKGDTIIQALNFVFHEKLKSIVDVKEIVDVTVQAYFCGQPGALESSVKLLDDMTVDAISVHDAVFISDRLSNMILFGDIRKLDKSPLEPILYRLSLRAAITLADEAHCDDEAANILAQDIKTMNEIFGSHDFLDMELWTKNIENAAFRDDINTKISGVCMAILLDMGYADAEALSGEVERRLSAGMPADLGAGWFEGLAMKNQYSLIARLSLWKSLSEYISQLDAAEFKRALLFLRRAFSLFSPEQKDMIGENLGEIWGLKGSDVSETVNTKVSKEEIADISDFDFDGF